MQVARVLSLLCPNTSHVAFHGLGCHLIPLALSAVTTVMSLFPQAGVNVSSSGTTASVVYQHRTSLWVAAAGDSRVLCMSHGDSTWNVQPLTLDHRPSRRTEKHRQALLPPQSFSGSPALPLASSMYKKGPPRIAWPDVHESLQPLHSCSCV